MKNFSRALVALLALFLLFTSLPGYAAVTASVDKDHIAPDETVHLLVQRDGSSDGQPDLDVLKRDFDILGNSRGSSVQIINGHVNSRTEVSLTLAPKHEGTIRIPPLQWDGEQSAALELTVGGSGNANGPTGQTQAQAPASTSHVFLTGTLDRKQSYVQAADVLTVRLYSDEPLYQASLDLPASNDILVRQLGKDVQTSESRNGRSYQVIERRYVLIPQRSGRLRLDGAVLDAQVADASTDDPFANDGFFGNAFGRLPIPRMMHSTRPLRVHAESLELNVLPRPAAATGANWLPARALTLTESWHPDHASIHVGEPITRHLHLASLGLTGAQLPDLGALMPVPDGIKAYPDQAKFDDNPQGETVLGRRDQDIAMLASRPGHYELPALKLSWWDTEHNAQREAVLPEHGVDILPAAVGSVDEAKQPTATPASGSAYPIPAPPGIQPGTPAAAINLTQRPRWPWISLFLGLLWLATLLAWWYSRRREARAASATITNEDTPAAIRAGNELKCFRKACRDNDPQAARTHLLTWATSVFPGHPALGLNALSRLLDNPRIVEPLRQLDRACYTGSEWHGESLAQLLTKPPVQRPDAERKLAIPALYP